MCLDVGAANFRGQLQNPSVLEAKRRSCPGPGVPRAVAPEAAPQRPSAGNAAGAGGREGVCAAPCGDRGGGGGGGRRGSRGPPVAPCHCPLPSAGRRRWAPGKLGYFGQAAFGALGGRPASRSGRKSRRRSRGSAPGQHRIRFGPNATLWTWSAKRRFRDLHLSPGPHLPPPGPPDRGVAKAGARGGQEQVGGRPGRPHQPPAPLNKGEKPSPGPGTCAAKEKGKNQHLPLLLQVPVPEKVE